MLTVVHTGKRTGECSVILSIEQEEKTFLPSALFEKIALKTRLANFCKWDACIGKPLCQGKADKSGVSEACEDSLCKSKVYVLIILYALTDTMEIHYYNKPAF